MVCGWLCVWPLKWSLKNMSACEPCTVTVCAATRVQIVLKDWGQEYLSVFQWQYVIVAQIVIFMTCYSVFSIAQHLAYFLVKWSSERERHIMFHWLKTIDPLTAAFRTGQHKFSIKLTQRKAYIKCSNQKTKPIFFHL